VTVARAAAIIKSGDRIAWNMIPYTAYRERTGLSAIVG
jgi:hypothetical protein